MKYGGGATYTYQPFKTTRDSFQNHARSKNLGIPRITVLIGSGWSKNPDEAVDEAKRLRADGVTVFTVGIDSYRASNDTHLRALGTRSLKSVIGPRVFSEESKRKAEKRAENVVLAGDI